jgi:hypothetical protein
MVAQAGLELLGTLHLSIQIPHAACTTGMCHHTQPGIVLDKRKTLHQLSRANNYCLVPALPLPDP